jgi:hypothetical protein
VEVSVDEGAECSEEGLRAVWSVHVRKMLRFDLDLVESQNKTFRYDI